MLSFFFFAVLVFIAHSTIIDKVVSPRSKWIELKRTDKNQRIQLNFYVKRRNLDALERMLMAVSDPESDRYGQFLSIPELQRFVGPTKKTVKKIKTWLTGKLNLQNSNIQSITINNDILSVVTSVGNAEKLLNTKYYDYQSAFDKNIIVSRVRMGNDYHVPSYIAPLLDYVSPTHRFPIRSTLKPSLNAPKAGAVTPTTLHALYNTGSTVGSAANNSVGIASFVRQYYDKSDLSAFWKKYDITACVVTDVPSSTPSGHGLEAELDTQYMSSMAQKVPMQVWYTAGSSTMNGFETALVEWSTNVLKSSNPPLLFSVSYGQTEKNFGGSFINKFNGDLMMLGTAGISVLFASGDSGAGGDCQGTEPFDPDYPASSPYVTAVGGVTGGTAGQKPLGEKAWLEGGGGFSNYAPTQSYQTAAVQAYLTNTNNLPDKTKYNATGRGYPDIAAQSVDFEIEVNGRLEGVSGTSCASPTAGGVFGLLNDLRKQNNMAQLGFLNPFIYQTGAKDANAFSDCETGYNRGCTPGTSRGFPAAKGWDAASGYGSPDYAVLKGYVLQTGKKTIRK